MVVILMGVAGSGKTTVGRRLASQMGWNFYEGDDFHSSSNIEKMTRGVALNDSDRQPWLDALQQLIANLLRRAENAEIACSALKKIFRERLLLNEQVKLVYLKGDFHLIEARLKARSGHFMAPELLREQFAILEEPEDAFHADVSQSVDDIVASIRDYLKFAQ
jgi:gluconokinase